MDASDACGQQIQRGMTIVLRNGEGERVCNATVLATEGAFSEVLRPFGGAASCEYYGLFNRAGTYIVSVAHPAYLPFEQTVAVAADNCGVTQTESREFSLVARATTDGGWVSDDAGSVAPDGGRPPGEVLDGGVGFDGGRMDGGRASGDGGALDAGGLDAGGSDAGAPDAAVGS